MDSPPIPFIAPNITSSSFTPRVIPVSSNRCGVPLHTIKHVRRKRKVSPQPAMTTSLPSSASTEDVCKTARSLHWSVRLTYDIATRCRGHLVLEHEAEFGRLRESALGSEDALKALITSVYGYQNTWVFRVASEALASFNTAFMALESISGLDTAGKQLAGYFLGGPTDGLLRVVREAASRNVDRSTQEVVTSIAQSAGQLKVTLEVESNSLRAVIHAEAERLVQGPHSSLEDVAAELRMVPQRRDARALAFVMLALAGWEPDLEGWDKNVASVIRGERALRGQYHLSLPLTRAVQRDILVGLSLDRRDVAFTLDGTVMLRVQTLHVNQDGVARYVRAPDVPNENMVATLWGPFDRTPVLDWETVKEFISQTGPIRYEWTWSFNRIKEIARACVLMGGLETGEVFLNMSSNLKENSPRLYSVWNKTIGQVSFAALTCVARTPTEARAAVIERMVMSTVTDGSCYHISSDPIYLRVENGIARLFDSEGYMVFVDRIMEGLRDREAADVGVKFFALLTRAMDGGIVKPGFYQDSTRQASVLRARGPREGFDKRDDTEMENTSVQVWRQLCGSPFAPGYKNRK